MPAATELGGRRSRARARLACWRVAHEPPDLVRAAPPSPSCRIRREGRRDAERRAAAPLCSRVLVIAQLMLRPPHLSLSFSSDLRATPSRAAAIWAHGGRPGELQASAPTDIQCIVAAAGADSGPLLAAPPCRGAHPITPLLRSG